LHTDEMFARRTLSHSGADGSTSRQRMVEAGYDFSGTSYSGENVAMRAGSGRGLDQTNVDALHRQFMTSSGHRANILNDRYEEVGVGLAGNTTNSWTTENFAGTSLRGPFLTGVAFDDRDGDRFYDPGEGLGAVAISIKSVATGALTQVSTWSAGGYQVRLAAGSYEVTFSGGGLAAPVTKGVTMGTRNLKLDLDADAPGAVATATELVSASGHGGGRRTDAASSQPEHAVLLAHDTTEEMALAAAPAPQEFVLPEQVTHAGLGSDLIFA
jgi:serralysin